jgi:hypothetical protein
VWNALREFSQLTNNPIPMSKILTPDIISGIWTYRSFLNSNDLTVQPNALLFGSGYIQIDEAPMNQLKGKIFGPNSSTNPNPVTKPYSWELDLNGSINYGDPYTIRFEGKGIVSGSQWIYQYVGYMVNPWQNGQNQVPAFVGSIVRAIPHPDGSGGVAPAGVVCSWYAVRYK